jgi:parallel beta-helix repeat protein
MSVRVRLKRCFFGAAGLAGAIALLIASAFPAGGFVRKPPPLPLIVSTSITACGRITHPGYYEVDSPLTAGSDPADCIQISAANVSLNLNGQTITGVNAGSGVHVMPTGAQAYIEGGGATIADFMDGVEIDGVGATVENFVASDNLDAGVLLNHARLATVANFATNGAGGGELDGVRLVGAAQNSIESFSASHVNRFGVWLLGSSHNSISGFTITYDGIAGIYLGCSMTGPDGSCKPSSPKSMFNTIFHGVSSYNSSGQAGYGVAADLGDISNRFSNISAQGNATYDVFDVNDVCGKNAWFALTVGKPQVPASCPD